MDSLANQFTPGYRARDVLYATSHLGSKRFPLRMNQGQLQETRDPYNLAIDGSGFFLLNDGSLTRDGSWAPLSQQPKARGLQETELPPTTSQSVLMRVLSFAFPTHKEVQPLSQFQASITAPASASA